MNKTELAKLRKKYSLKNFLTPEEYELARSRYMNVKVKPLVNIPDIKLDPKQTYNRIKFLKKSGVEVEYTQDMIDEYSRCHDDPVYFINAYVKIVHVDFGKVPFNLRPFQEDIVQICNEFDKVVINSSRQVGKCLELLNTIRIFRKRQYKNSKYMYMYMLKAVILNSLYDNLLRIKVWLIEQSVKKKSLQPL